VVGCLPYLLKHGGPSKLHQVFDALRSDFGNVVRFDPVKRNMVVVFHPDNIEKIYQAANPYPSKTSALAKAFEMYVKERNIQPGFAALEGEEWKKKRMPLQREILPPNKAASFLPNMARVTEVSSKVIVNYQNDIREFVLRYTFESLGSIMFDQPFDVLTNANDKGLLFLDNISKCFELAFEIQNEPAFLQGKTKKYPQFRDAVDKMAESIYGFLDDHKFGPNSVVAKYKEKGMSQEDLVMDVLTSFFGGEFGKMFFRWFIWGPSLFLFFLKLSLINPSFFFFYSGIHSTSIAILWSLIHLASFPRVQEKLRAEARLVLQGRTMSTEDVENLPYLKLFFKESLRLDSPANVNVRKFHHEMIIEGKVIPPEVDILVTTGSMLRDPNIFENPDLLIPERWTEEEKAKRAAAGNRLADHPYLYLPFSIGTRICIGKRLVENEVYQLVSRLVQDHEIKLAPGQPKIEKKTKIFTEPNYVPKFVFVPVLK